MCFPHPWKNNKVLLDRSGDVADDLDSLVLEWATLLFLFFLADENRFMLCFSWATFFSLYSLRFHCTCQMFSRILRRKDTFKSLFLCAFAGGKCPSFLVILSGVQHSGNAVIPMLFLCSHCTHMVGHGWSLRKATIAFFLFSSFLVENSHFSSITMREAYDCLIWTAKSSVRKIQPDLLFELDLCQASKRCASHPFFFSFRLLRLPNQLGRVPAMRGVCRRKYWWAIRVRRLVQQRRVRQWSVASLVCIFIFAIVYVLVMQGEQQNKRQAKYTERWGPRPSHYVR